MLKKLKIKFIVVIMAVVTVLFAVIISGILHFTRLNMERESLQMMRAMSFQPMGMNSPVSLPNDIDNKMRLPFFRLHIDSSGVISASGGDYYDLSDTELLRKLIEAVNEQDKEFGTIREYDLRFFVNEQPDGRTIVFADISSERTMLNGLIQNCIILGLIGYAVFFIISLLLAKWVTKPVEKTWNEQKQFIADASHELKTPLTVIMTNAEMLEDRGYSEADRSIFTKNILYMSKRMRGLVESLLDLARMDNRTSSAEMKRLVHKGMNAVLSVSGKGSPLSKADCKNIFKRFYRVDQARTDGESYGLRLAIAESIVKEHGGRIWAESEDGSNTFFVSLNMKKQLSC